MLLCSDGPFFRPTSQSEYDEVKAASTAFIQALVDSSTPSGIVEFLSTKQVVQDYEMIRKALGYEKINFLGVS